MTDFAWDYLWLAFVSTVGAVQVAAAYGNLRGLLLVHNRPLAFLAGAALAAGAFAWFFLTGERNLSDTEGGLNGGHQAVLFSLGGGAGVLVSLLAASLRNRALGEEPEEAGLEALRQTTWLKAVRSIARRRWKVSSRRSSEPTAR